MGYSSELHSELFEEWQKERNYKPFCTDGIIDISHWSKSNPKILFLLKESNDHFYEIADKEDGWGPKGNSKVFWRNINIWSYIISEIYNGRKPLIDRIYSIKENKVNSIAYVNVKKRADCKPVSDNNEIYEFAVADKDFIKRQIELIKPDVIYCAGTINSFKAVYEDAEKISDNVYLSKGRLVLDYYHPSCRSSYQKTFNNLLSILNSRPSKSQF